MNILIVDNSRKSTKKFVDLIKKCNGKAQLIEAKDPSMASIKYKNQRFDFLIINNDIFKTTLSLVQDVLTKKQTSKDHIIIIYDEITQDELVQYINIGITCFLNKASSDQDIVQKIGPKFLQKAA